MAFEDSVKAWQAAVENGLISGDPKYYSGAVDENGDTIVEPGATAEEYYHALIVAILESEGIDWQGNTEPPPPPPPPPSGELGEGKDEQTTTIHLNGVSNMVIEGRYFNGRIHDEFVYRPERAGNAHVCILLTNCNNITVRNCDFEDVSEPVAVIGGSNITVENNRAKGILGPGSAGWMSRPATSSKPSPHPTGVKVRGNKIVVYSDYDPWNGAYERFTEDVISFFSASNCEAVGNWIDATGYVRDYGTGIIAGDAYGSNVLIQDNRLLNPGQVGIAIAGDPDHVVDGNWIWKDADQNPGSGNTAAYCWDYNGGTPTNNVVFRNNRAKWNAGGGFWNPGPPPAATSNNDWDDDSLSRSDVEFTL